MNQKQICSENTGVRFDEKYDICVVGLGTAGAIALIAAAKKGLKVLGIEKTNYLGGVGTGGPSTTNIFYISHIGFNQFIIFFPHG